ncbi:hypothetical protein WB334_25005, partial [Escherichia coli]|uniref:hypothetical protein n=1 Tax=Escherichia coli TaxID=562 RepID=UPI002158665F
FMLDLGSQPASAAYSMIHFAYYGVVVAAMGALAASQFRRSSGVQLIPLGSLLLGSIFGVVLSLTVFTMDLAHVFGDLELMYAASIAYGVLYLLAFFVLCFGFAAQPAARMRQARSRTRATRALVAELDPLWQRAVGVRPGISQIEDAEFHPDEPETML